MLKRKIIIQGVVVLYNPDESILKNINSYVNIIDKLYIVDNSENKNLALIDKIKAISTKCIYIDNNGNQGIAHALNVGANLAIKNNAEWLLTMDQDSIFENKNLEKLISNVKEQDSKQVGLISPLHETALSKVIYSEIENVLTVMTSGNIISLYAYKIIGGFKNQYFIDAVDWEYCLNLNLNNFKVIRFNKIYLKHNLGEATIHKTIFNKDIVILNHNKIRKYYIVRNKLLLSSQYYKYYPKTCIGYIKSILIDYKNVLFYEKDKFNKLKYMTKGIFDFLFQKFGKLNN